MLKEWQSYMIYNQLRGNCLGISESPNLSLGLESMIITMYVCSVPKFDLTWPSTKKDILMNNVYEGTPPVITTVDLGICICLPCFIPMSCYVKRHISISVLVFAKDSNLSR